MVSLPSLLKFISVVLTSHIFHTKRQMPTFDLFWFFQAPGSLSIHAPWSIRMFVFPYFYHVGWDIECLVLSSRRRWMWNFIFAFCGGVYVWFWLWSVRGSCVEFEKAEECAWTVRVYMYLHFLPWDEIHIITKKLKFSTI